MPFGRAISLLLLGLFAPIIHAQEPVDADASAPPIRPEVIEQLFTRTETYFRPASAERLVLLSLELEARGLSQSARDVRSRVRSADLASELLRLGLYSAAGELANHWQREEPNNADAPLFAAVAHYAQGASELARRSLDALKPDHRPALNAVLRDLSTFQSRNNQPLSAEANPWNIRFQGPTGTYEAGRLADPQRAKLPATATAGLADLIELLPTSAPLWALLGELLNAQGQVASARTAFERARSLGYTPRWLIDHARILKEHEDAQRRQADAALPAPMQSQPPAPGWQALADRPRELWVIIIGSIIALVLLVLQFRQWFRNSSPRRPS